MKCFRDSSKVYIKYKHLKDEWDFEKNSEMGVYFQKVSVAFKDKVWWKCPKCRSSYDMLISKKVNRKQKCPYCRGLRVNHTNSLGDKVKYLVSEWHPTKNGDLTAYQVTVNSNKKAWWLGECGHEWETAISHRTRKTPTGCPYCAGQKVNHTNNISVTNPEGAVFWNHDKNEVPIEVVTKGSHRNYWWMCKDCDYEWYSGVKNFLRKPRCPSCTRDTSYPERLMNAVLSYCNIDFELEKVFEWLPNKRYDFYLTKHNTIIEVHGLQHYKGGFRETIDQTKANDELKKSQALKNGIDNYITIDARYSDVEYILNNIKESELNDLLSIDSIDTLNIEDFKKVV